MTERAYNPFTGKGTLRVVGTNDQKLKRFLSEDDIGLTKVAIDEGVAGFLVENEESE
jgi:hypothetical protein